MEIGFCELQHTLTNLSNRAFNESLRCPLYVSAGVPVGACGDGRQDGRWRAGRRAPHAAGHEGYTPGGEGGGRWRVLGCWGGRWKWSRSPTGNSSSLCFAICMPLNMHGSELEILGESWWMIRGWRGQMEQGLAWCNISAWMRYQSCSCSFSCNYDSFMTSGLDVGHADHKQ